MGNGEVKEWDGDTMASVGDNSQAMGDSGKYIFPGLSTVATREDEEIGLAAAWDSVADGRIRNCMGNGEDKEWDGDMIDASVDDPS